MKEYIRRFLAIFVVAIMFFVAWNVAFMVLNLDEKPKEKFVDVGPGLHIDLNLKENEEHDWEGKSLNYKAHFPEKVNDNGIEFYTEGICVEQYPSELTIGNEYTEYPTNEKGKIKDTKIRYEDVYDDISIEFCMGLETLKKSYIINKLPNNLLNYHNLILSSKLILTKNKEPFNNYIIKIDGDIRDDDITTSSSIEFFTIDNEFIFSIPQSYIEDSPDYVWSSYENKYLPDFGTVDRKTCNYKLIQDDNLIYLDLIVPKSFLTNKNTRYPVFIDPSISPNPVNVTVLYQGLYNGTILRQEDEERTYYENVSKTIIQDSDLTITTNGSLTLSNIILKMNTTYDGEFKIDVHGEFNIMNSNITNCTGNSKYDLFFHSNSKGSISQSTIEMCGYTDAYGNEVGSGGISINSSNIKIKDSIIQNGGDSGIVIYQATPEISNNLIKDILIDGIYSSSSYPTILDNEIYNCTTGIRWENNLWNDSYDTSEKINLSENIRINNGYVELDNKIIGIGFFTTEDIQILSNAIWKNIWVLKSEPKNDTIISISVIDSATNNTIPKFTNLNSSNVDLSRLDPGQYPKIRFRVDFFGNGSITSTPYLYDLSVQCPVEYLWEDSFSDWSLTSNYSNIRLINDAAELDLNVLINENCNDNNLSSYWNKTGWTESSNFEEEDYIWNITMNGSDSQNSFVFHFVNDTEFENGTYEISGKVRYNPINTTSFYLPFFGFNNTYPYFSNYTSNWTKFEILLYPEGIYSGVTNFTYNDSQSYTWFEYNITVEIENSSVVSRNITIIDVNNDNVTIINATWEGKDSEFSGWGIENDIGNGYSIGKYKLDDMLVSHGYKIYGNLTSELISTENHGNFNSVYINKTEPDENHYITIDILNGTTTKVIPGFNNLSATYINISSLKNYPSIRLRAEFYGNNSITEQAKLNRWQVGIFSTIGGNEISGNIVGININGSSPTIKDNKLENVLNIFCSYSTSQILENEITKVNTANGRSTIDYGNQSGIGIFCHKSCPIIIDNTITDSSYGIYLNHSSGIENNTLPIFNYDRDVIFTSGSPPSYDGDKTTYINAPNLEYTIVKKAMVDLEGQQANYFGNAWNDSDLKVSNAPCPAYYPQEKTPSIIADNGNIYVVWSDYRVNESTYNDGDIFFNKFDGSSWNEEDLKISNEPVGTNQTNPVIAVDSGNIYVAWQDDRGGAEEGYDIYFNMYNGTSWQDTDTKIDHGDSYTNQQNPTIAVDNGTVYVAWDDDRNTDIFTEYDIYLNSYNGSSWQPEDTIICNGPRLTNQQYPAIAAENGSAYAVWQDDRNGDYDIYYNYFNGSDWRTYDEKVSHDPIFNPWATQYTPTIAVYNGNITVAWTDWRRLGLFPDFDIYFNYNNSNSWLSNDIQIDNGPRNANQSNPAIANDNGDVYVVWQDSRNHITLLDIYLNNCSGGIWGTVDVRISDNISDISQINSAVAANNSKVYVVWEDWRNGDADIYFNKSVSGSWDSSNTLISNDWGSYPPTNQTKPSIASENGNIYVVWEDDRDGDYDIYFNEYNGSTWGVTDVKISHGSEGTNQRDPEIATYNGSIAVVWEDDRYSDFDIFANVYNGSSWEATDSRVNCDWGPASQLNPTVSYKNDKIYAAWEDWRNPIKSEIYFNNYTSGSWGNTDTQISHGVPDMNQTNPKITTGNVGNIYVVWENKSNIAPIMGILPLGSVSFGEYVNGNWSEVDTKVDNSVAIAYPDISVLNNKIYVTWEDNRGVLDTDIYFNERVNGEWGTLDVKVNHEPSASLYVNQSSPTITSYSNKIHIVWMDDREGADIYYNIRQGSNWRNYDTEVSNDPGYSTQNLPDIANYNNEIYVVWEDNRDGEYNIYYNDYLERYSYSYPRNPTLDVGENGNVDWNYDGEFKIKQKTKDFSNELQSYLNSFGSEEQSVQVPLKFHSDNVGKINVSNIIIEYETRPFISDNLISNCSYGIIIENSSTPVLYKNDIGKCTFEGIYINNSNAIINRNNIYSTIIGINTSAGKITIINCSLAYNIKDIQGTSSTFIISNTNFLNTNLTAIEISNSDLKIVSSTISNSKTSFKGVESEITVDNCSIINSSDFDFDIQDGSQVFLINTTHDIDKLSIINSSDLSVNWYLHIRLLHENETGVNGGFLSIYDNSYPFQDELPLESIGDYVTDANGYVNWILCNDYVIDANDFREYETPHTIMVGEDNNIITLPMDISKTVSLFYGTDSDLDKIDDTIENQANVLWFEAEHHVRNQEQIIIYENYGDASNFKTVKHQVNSKMIINNTFPLSLLGLGTYQCFIRAKIADSPDYDNVTINISIYQNDTKLINNDLHLITPTYEWYSTPEFSPTIKYVRLELNDLDSNSENVYVDKIMFVRIKNQFESSTNSNYGQTTDPLDPDTERDRLIDGLEVRPNTYWYEAEDYISNRSYQIIDDINASNAKTADHNRGFRNISYISTTLYPTINSKYKYYIKARNNTIDQNTFINVSVDDGSGINYYHFEVTDKYEWYSTPEFIPSFPLGFGQLNITVYDENDPNLFDENSYTFVDKIMLVDVSEIFINKFSDNLLNETINFTTQNFNNTVTLKIPYDATATIATMDIWGTTSSKRITETGESHNPAIYQDKIVYESQNEIILYDTSNGNEYIITNYMGVHPSTPSIHGNRIVWVDYRNGPSEWANADIYMYDLGSDGEYGTDDDGDIGGYQITVDPTGTDYHQLNPDIWGDYIVWENHSSSPTNVNIHLYNLTTDTNCDGIPNYRDQDRPNPDPAENKTTNDADLQYNPAISENRIVWEDDRNGHWDIYMYDLSIFIEKYNSYKERRMTTNSNDQRTPDIYGDRIVWADDRGSNWAIFIYDLLTESELKLYESLGKNNGNPSIFGDKVVWDHQQSVGNSDVYAYDLSVDSDWDGIPNYLENPKHLNDPALLKISSNNSNQVEPDIGGDIVVWEVSGDIYFTFQNYSLDVGNDGEKCWYHSEIFTIPEATQNFAGDINKYLKNHQQDAVGGYIFVPLNFTSELKGKIILTNLTIDLEFLIDPLDKDTDSDNLEDGGEIFRFFGYDIIEFEDAIQFKEWKPPHLSVMSINQQYLSEFKFDTSPTMHQTHVTLISSRNLTDSDAELGYYRDSWVKLRTHINKTGLYKFRIDPALNDANNLGFDIVDDTSLWAYKYVGNAESFSYYPVKLNDMGKHIRINKSLADYIKKVIANATYINIERSGTENIEPEIDSVYSTASITKVQMGTSTKGISSGNLAVYANWIYTADYKLSQHTDYMIYVGLNLELLPPELLPEFKNHPSIDSEVPDNLPWENITFLELMNLDCIRVERQTLNPLTIDADKDGLTDGFEANDTLFPLNPDADGDGLNDYIEMFETGTNFAYRDTDLDGIRDGVEVGYTQSEIELNHGEIKSPGSWLERIAHWNSPYLYIPINNWDGDNGSTVTDPFDTDTDGDFIPDGWTDGWYYSPSPIDPSSTRTYHTNNNRYKDVNNWRYDEKYWGITAALDNIVQIYEGEDLNLDGNSSTGITNWGFDNKTFTRHSTTQGETSPVLEDTDFDNIPDGYEVWYSHLEPYFYLNTTSNDYEYILNPTSWGDKDFDKDAIEIPFYEYSIGSSYYSVSSGLKALAQKISVPSNHEYHNISKIAVHFELPTGAFARAEIWYGDPNQVGASRKPTGWITHLDNHVVEDNGWYYFNVPDAIFDMDYELSANGIDYYIVIRYIDTSYSWYYHQGGSLYEAFIQNSDGSWSPFYYPYTRFHHKLLKFDFDNAGDNLTNLGEYIVGTNPKNNNTDTIKIGTKEYSDYLEDGFEVGYQINDTLLNNPNPKGGIIFRTNIIDGALKFKYYDNSSAWIQYDGDGNGSIINIGYYYNYSTTLIDPRAPEPCTSKENILLFLLEDGGEIYLSPDSGHNKMYIWEPDVNLENYKIDSNEYEYIDGKCVVFNKTIPVDMSNLTLDINYRYQELYISNPFDYDTDSDGVKDGDEINWKEESEISALDPDTIINVRDPDSDNDGIEDGREVDWSEDFVVDPDSLENMIDPDSDDDGLYDGDEPTWWADTDKDGSEDMLDKDSDDDELEDGPEVEPYKKDNSNQMESVDLISNLKTPKGIDIDDSGNIFFIENEYPTGAESIKLISKEYDEIEPIDNSENVHELLSSNYLFDPHDLVIDREGNLYYTEDQPSGNDYLKMLPHGYNISNPSENAETIKILLNSSIGGISDPKGIAIDGNGNIFYTCYNSLKMLPSGFNLNNTTANAENVKTLLSGVSNIHGLSIDNIGNLYFTIESGSGSICKLYSDYVTDNSSRNYFKTLLANLNSPQDIDIDASYNIYFTCGDDVTLLPSNYFENYPSVNTKNLITVISTSNSYYPEYLTVNGRGDIFFTVKGVSETTYQRVEKIRTARTSPILNDTDFDGLWDGYNITSSGDVEHPGELDKHHEYQTGNETYQLESDSDFDGLLDGQEVAGIFIENDGYDYWKGWCIQVQYVSSECYEQGQNYLINVSSDPMDNDGDTDDDGISDYLEYRYTNPAANDTDADGLNETTEDKNKNGRLDAEETSPIDRDTDDDRLPDGNMSIDNYWVGEDRDLDGIINSSCESNPLDSDTDGDMVADGNEYYYENADDEITRYSDADCDGLMDILERDSDYDGLDDGVENWDLDDEFDRGTLKLWDGTNITNAELEADPTNPDCDDDGLLDGAEPMWRIDLDRDGEINVWDKDSNMIIDTTDDYNDVFVIFRTDAEDDKTLAENGSYIDVGPDGKLDYVQNTEIAVLYNKIYHKLYSDGYWYDLNNDNPTQPHGSGDWQITNIYRYKYSSDQSNPNENDLYNISLNYTEFPSEYNIPILEDDNGDPIITKYLDVKTPEGYNVYLEDANGQPEPTDNIIIELINESKYVRFEPYSMGTINTSIHSIPKSTPYEPNYVGKHQEFYDPRLALNMDLDFDGISNTEELLFGTNPYDADTDNDGIIDGAEINWNVDVDGDGSLINVQYNDTSGCHNITYNSGINALDYDSDDDGIWDGVEFGLIEVMHKTHSKDNITNNHINWTDNETFDPPNYDFDLKFKADEDPTTITNMTNEDTDHDDLNDGSEDSNKNGKVDSNEPDPNDADSDDDGVVDGHVKEGVGDSDEDGTKNCLDYDSDDDGVFDGTELGVTTAIPESEEIKGTDINSLHFVIDSDPATTTDPTNEDDDGDHLLDGLEDKNHNGAFDDGETDPLDVDTDDDGLNDGDTGTGGGEDTNLDGVVDDDESDPCKKDTDGDNLWDGDEVAPGSYDYDKYENRYNSGWYTSYPYEVDSDNDGLNDDQEIKGWPVRIFWEATLETVKGPYNVYSNPMVKDTDSEGLEDDQEFAYGADPDEPDTDDDNVNDDVEVDRGDNPCGIEGRPPEITKLTVSAVPVVDDYQGTPYLKGWDVTVSISAEDSSGPYKFALKVLGGTLVEVELQEDDEDGYYKTEIDGSATVYVENDGSWDYCSIFISTTEDSVGNVLGTYIVGDGLPQYSNNILTLINDDEDEVSYKRDVSGIEYESVLGDIINVEIGQWLAEKIFERLEATMEKIKSSMSWKNSMQLLNYLEGLKEEVDKNNPKSIIEYMKNNELSIEEEQVGTRGNDQNVNEIIFYLEIALEWLLKGSEDDASDFMYFAQLVYNENDFDDDDLNDWEEYALNTGHLDADSDNDGIWDGAEIYGYPAKNRPSTLNKFYYKTNPMIDEGWDTDGDGCGDGDDPIPLDYDIDGDGYVNIDDLANQDSCIYVDRLKNPIDEDPNLICYESGGLISDDDKDGDGIPYTTDEDCDNDGMSDFYEMKYGCIGSDSMSISKNGKEAYNEVDGKGWQHVFLYNERYAILIAGGGMKEGDKDSNMPAFWNDIKHLHGKLMGYHFKNENVFTLRWKKNPGYYDDIYVYGPASLACIQNILGYEIGEKITKNDFLFFTINCHSSDSAWYQLYDPELPYSPTYYSPHPPFIEDTAPGRSFYEDLEPMLYARMAIVIVTCSGGNSLPPLGGNYADRIVMSSTAAAETGYTTVNNYLEGTDYKHTAFLYEGKRCGGMGYWRKDSYPGFSKKLGDKDSPKSIYYAWSKGYDACRHNIGYYFGDFSSVRHDGRSTPQISDYGNIASYTYL